MGMNAGPTTAPRDAGSPETVNYSFKKLRDHLPVEQKNIADDLDVVRCALEVYGASAAAARLRQLDDYATTLPPESLPGLIDSTATLDELDAAAADKYKYPWLVAARNVLALFPLLFTWWSLSRATNAYQAEVHAHPNLVYQPFLILWENGFGQQLWPSFSFVAGADALLFIFIIIITAGIHGLERWAQKNAQQIVARMDQSVTQLVAVLSLSRVTFSGNPSDWAAAVQRVIAKAMDDIRQLAQAGQAVTQTASSAAQAAAAAAATSRAGIEQIADTTRTYVEQVKSEFAETVRQLHDEDKAFLVGLQHEANERLIFAHEEASKQMREQFNEIARQMAERFDVISREIMDETQASREAIRQMREESRDALAHINVENRQFLADANRESLATLTRAAEQADGITERLRESVAALQPVIEQHKDGAEVLVDAVGKIGDVTQRFGDNMQTFTSTAGLMDAHVQEIVQTHERFTQRVETMVTTLTSVASETKAATADIQSTTAQMRDALDLATIVGGDVKQASQLWSQAQASLPNITRAMEEAADNLRNQRVQLHIEAPRGLLGRIVFGRPSKDKAD